MALRQVSDAEAQRVWVALEAVEYQRNLVLETKGDAPTGVLGRRVAKLIRYENEYTVAIHAAALGREP